MGDFLLSIMGGGQGAHPHEFRPKVKGHVNYILSPHRSRYFVGFFTGAPARWTKKLMGAWAWAPGIISGIAIYEYAQYKEY